jgi:plastocyanin
MPHHLSLLAFVLSPLVGALVPATPALADGGTLTGRIVAGESVKAPAPLSVAVDAWVCAPDGKTPDPSLSIGEQRGLANVVVRIDVPDAPTAVGEGEVLIDQKRCAFIPHVAVVAPGQVLRVTNSDRVLHNFRTITAHNRAVHKAQIGGKEDGFTFKTPEIIRAACDVHYWMSAIIVVAPHAFIAVTDAAGRFAIGGLVPGSYRAELWHERLGTKKAAVIVEDEGGLFELTWDVAAPKAAAEPVPSGQGSSEPSTPR